MSAAPLPPEDDLLAAELALGLLDGGERVAAERRADAEPDFAAAHRFWQEQAATLVDANEAPPAALWSAIAARLPANDTRVPVERVRRWQFATAAAAVLALVMGGVALRPPPPRPAPPLRPAPVPAPLVAVLSGDTDDAMVAVSFEPNGRRLTIAPARLDLGRKVAELWVIPAGQAPRSIGVIDAGAPRLLTASALVSPVLIAGATLAVSVEPIGGSPTGQPTGPVILTGKMSKT